MTFKDILKKSFLEGYSTVSLSGQQIAVVMLLSCILAMYIFFCYRLLTRRTFYSKSFNISLVALTIITSGIILTIQSSVVVSLGMVGALSIVRFRTAIKDPMDLVFLFWSIGTGIICGAGLVEIAVIMAIVVAAVLFGLDKLPVASAPKILVVNAENSKEISDDIEDALKKYAGAFKEKSRSISGGRLDLVVELRTKDGRKLVDELTGIEGISNVSLLAHDGEVTF